MGHLVVGRKTPAEGRDPRLSVVVLEISEPCTVEIALEEIRSRDHVRLGVRAPECVAISRAELIGGRAEP